jgi:triacylglycerol esterase/lipase EstA (alpha/beta hydrolase family)
MNDLLTRRRLLLAAAAAGTACLVACATRPGSTDLPPIVFVHGNGDTAALWMTTIWRFESNGWPRERLHAMTCRTRWRAMTTPRNSRAAARPLSTRLTWPPK